MSSYAVIDSTGRKWFDSHDKSQAEMQLSAYEKIAKRYKNHRHLTFRVAEIEWHEKHCA